MRIAVVTSAEYEYDYTDIEIIVRAIEHKGHIAETVLWDAPDVDWANFDTIFIDSTWDYTEKYDAFLAWCRHVSTISNLVNSLEIIELSSNKRYLLTLAAAGLRLPQTDILAQSAPVDEAVLARYQGKIVIKPLVGSSGVGTVLFDNREALINADGFKVLHAKGDLLVQEYMPEIKTLGEVSAIFIAGQLSHCVLKKSAPGEFRVQCHYGGVTTLTTPPAYVEKLYRQVASALGVNSTYMRLDFIPADEPIVMEVEMVEPDKFYTLYPEGADILADALVGKL